MSKPIEIFASRNDDSAILECSSSGGVFSFLAEKIIKEGGVVFGARWDDDWSVIHSYSETIDGLSAFRLSKYVQSRIGNSYKDAERFLIAGRKVLFSGTPCQIAGLKVYLKQDYDNLFCVECVCHGTPPAGLWHKYLAEISEGRKLMDINFRDKSTGWRNYSVTYKFTDGTIISRPHDNDPWMRGLIHNLTIRNACFSCKHKINDSSADVTLGDLWGVDKLLPGLNDDCGVSLVVVNTRKGQILTEGLHRLKHFSFERVVEYNCALVEPANPNKAASKFAKMRKSGGEFHKTIMKLTKDPLQLRIKRYVRSVIK